MEIVVAVVKYWLCLGSAQPGGEEPSWSKRMKSEVGKDEADGAN
jgi:hypothetical protein